MTIYPLALFVIKVNVYSIFNCIHESILYSRCIVPSLWEPAGFYQPPLRLIPATPLQSSLWPRLSALILLQHCHSKAFDDNPRLYYIRDIVGEHWSGWRIGVNALNARAVLLQVLMLYNGTRDSHQQLISLSPNWLWTRCRIYYLLV